MTYCSADFQSAVSQNCILLAWPKPAPGKVRNPADCKSAIQQIENLRYVTALAAGCSKRLDEAFTTISKIPAYWLAEWTHQVFPEWEDPTGSSLPIDPKEILRIEKKSEKEISEIEEELATVNQLMIVTHRSFPSFMSAFSSEADQADR